MGSPKRLPTDGCAGHRVGGTPRRNLTGDPILTMEPPGTPVRNAVSPGHARPEGPKLSVLLRRRYAFSFKPRTTIAGASHHPLANPSSAHLPDSEHIPPQSGIRMSCPRYQDQWSDTPQHLKKLRSAGVAATQDERDALPGQPLPQAQTSRQGRRASCLDEVARCLDHQRLRSEDLVVADEHEGVEPLPEDLLWELECRAGGKALGDRLHPVYDEAALLPGAERGRCSLRLDSDDLDRRTDRLRDDAGAGRAAAATDGNDDHVGL